MKIAHSKELKRTLHNSIFGGKVLKEDVQWRNFWLGLESSPTIFAKKSFLQSPLKKIAQKYKLELLLLFGSQARGVSHAKSDLDLAFFSLSKVDEQHLYEDLIRLFHREDIDLVNLYTTHNHSLRYEILSKGIVLYEKKKGIKNTMEGQSFIDYMDFQRYYAMRSKLLDAKIKAMVSS